MKISKIFDSVIILGLVAALFVPFIVADSQFFPFITGKAFVFRILVEILFGVWLAGMFWNKELIPKFSWITGSVLVFIALITLADLSGVSFYRSFWSNFERMDGLITLLHMLAYFFVAAATLNNRFKWNVFFNTSIAASVIMSFYAFLQMAHKIQINQGGVRVDGTFGNATYLAVYMLFNIFIALFLTFRAHQENRSYKWFVTGVYGIAMLFQGIVLYATATRGAILGLIGGVLLPAIIVAIWGKEYPGFRKISIGTIAAVLILVGGFFAIRNADFVKRSPTLNRFASLSVQELNTQGRRYVWPMAVKGFLEKPILGWGQENFNYVFNKYYDPRMFTQEPWFDRAHNVVLDWLVAGGLLGFLGYMSMFVAVLVLIIKSKKFSLIDKAIWIGLLAAYFFQNLFVFDNLVSYMYFFAILAFVHSDFVQEKTNSWFERVFGDGRTAQKIAPVVAVILVIVFIYGLNAKQISANREIIQAIVPGQLNAEDSLLAFKKVFDRQTFADGEATEQLFVQMQKFGGADVSDQAKKDFAELAVNRFNIQLQKYPNDARTLLFTGTLLDRLGDFKTSIPYLERALENSPKKQSIMFELGLAHLSAGEYSSALETLKKAYDEVPDFNDAKILYAVALLYNKNIDEAKKIMAQVPVEVLVSDERIIAALAGTGHLSDAVGLIEKRAVLQPKSPEVRFRLAAGYLALNQRAKAIEILRVISKDFPANKDQADYYIKEIQAGRNP